MLIQLKVSQNEKKSLTRFSHPVKKKEKKKKKHNQNLLTLVLIQDICF